MSERDRSARPATAGDGPGTDEGEQAWLLTQETPGLDPQPIREAAGPDWVDDEAARGDGDGETIDEADVDTGPTSGQGGATGR